MENSIANIIIKERKAYISNYGKTNTGIYIDTEPVLICDISVEEISMNIIKIQEATHPHFQINSQEEFKKLPKVILNATGAKSWKELARKGYSYTIGWSEKGVLIQMSRLDKQGRWEWDPEKTRHLPLDTPLRNLVQIILDDVQTRSSA